MVNRRNQSAGEQNALPAGEREGLSRPRVEGERRRGDLDETARRRERARELRAKNRGRSMRRGA